MFRSDLMGLLLDTQVVLWWLNDDPTLNSAVKDPLDGHAEVFVSAASVWEVGIKQTLGKISGEDNLAERVKESGFALVPITAEHVIAAAALPLHHRDPFDRDARRPGCLRRTHLDDLRRPVRDLRRAD